MIVVAIENLIVRKGLELLVREKAGHRKVIGIGSQKELAKLLSQQHPNLLFVHSGLQNALRGFHQNDEQMRIVRVLDKKSDILSELSFQTDILYVDDDEAGLIKNIKRNLALSSNNTKQIDTDSGLSDRERDILREIALGKTNKEIADDLFISAHTVITHRKNITKKLGIKTVSGLTVYAILNKIIQMDEI